MRVGKDWEEGKESGERLGGREGEWGKTGRKGGWDRWNKDGIDVDTGKKQGRNMKGEKNREGTVFAFILSSITDTCVPPIKFAQIYSRFKEANFSI